MLTSNIIIYEKYIYHLLYIKNKDIFIYLNNKNKL
jgi:hypothetical protein